MTENFVSRLTEVQLCLFVLQLYNVEDGNYSFEVLKPNKTCRGVKFSYKGGSDVMVVMTDFECCITDLKGEVLGVYTKEYIEYMTNIFGDEYKSELDIDNGIAPPTNFS